MDNIFSGEIREIVKVSDSFMSRGFVTKREGRYSDCLVYVIKGKTKYSFGDYSFSVSDGDIFYLPKDSIYTMDITTDHYQVIYVDFYFSDDSVKEAITFPASQIPKGEKLFRSLLWEWMQRRPAFMQMIRSILYEILGSIERSSQKEYMPSAKTARLYPVVDYIRENFALENISVPYLAMLSNLSEAHFRRLFKGSFGVSPARYIINLKITHAKELLMYQNYSMEHIAESVGFQSSSYFSRIFKQETGLTPLEYRSRYN